MISGETFRIDDSRVYEELKGKKGIRDILCDGRTLHIDRAALVDCIVICEDYIPDDIFIGLDKE